VDPEKGPLMELSEVRRTQKSNETVKKQ